MKERLRRAFDAAREFALAPARPEPLAVLRIGVALVLLAQAASIAPVLFEIYGRTGVVRGPLRDAFGAPGLPGISWMVALLGKSGAAETPILVTASLSYVASLILLALGLFTRAAALSTWALHLFLGMAAGATIYGADQYAHLALFYLVIAPAGEALSLDHHLGRVRSAPSWRARIALRLVQIHLCLSYLAAGVAKARGEEWWNGEAIWRASMLPEYRQIDASFLASVPLVPMVIGWGVLVFEIGYPVLIWPRLTRGLWVALTVAMHAGIAMLLGLHVFGALMAVLTFAAFGVRAEPQRPERIA